MKVDPTRSRNMSAVRSANTALEMAVRLRLHAMGYRYRLHPKSLPGHPDILLPKKHAVLFFHGCFWHLHGCQRSSIPRTNEKFWRQKLTRNAERDCEIIESLLQSGWRVGVVWECAVRPHTEFEDRRIESVSKAVARFLEGKRGFFEIPTRAKRPKR